MPQEATGGVGGAGGTQKEPRQKDDVYNKPEPRQKDDEAFAAPPVKAPLPSRFNPTFNIADRANNKPFWETEGFKSFIQTVKEGGHSRGTPPANFVQTGLAPNKSIYDVASPKSGKYTLPQLKSRITTEVKNSIAYVPPGTTKEQVQKFVDEQVKTKLDSYQQPRYVFLSNGAPVFLNQKDERQSFVDGLKDKTPIQKAWLTTKYDVAHSVTNLLSSLGKPSLKAEALLTDDQTHTNILGAMAQLGYNSAILGWEYVRGGLSYTNLTQADVDAYQRAANNVRAADPTKAALLDRRAKDAAVEIANSKSVVQRIADAKAAVMRSWAQLQEDRKYLKDHPDVAKALAARGPQGMQQRLKYYAQVDQQEQQAKIQAASLRQQATTATQSGDYTKALQYIKDAQAQDRLSNPIDSYGAYTWSREPEKEKAFLDDTALVELQAGRPLTDEEVQRIKEYHVNSWTEGIGQAIFDPINLIPAKVLEEAVSIPVKVAGKTIEAVRETFPVVDKTLDVLGSPIRWMQRQAVTSAGNQIARDTQNIFQQVTRAYATQEDMVRAVDDISHAVIEAKRANTLEGAEAIFNTYRSTTDGMKNITFNDFKRLVDASDHLSPEGGAWAKMFENSMNKAEDQLTAIAAKRGVATEELVSDVSKSRRALDDLAYQFNKAYVDPHRIFKGSSFTDDTISGWISKTLRNMSGDEINDALKLNGFDQFLRKYSETLAPRTKAAIRNVDKVFEGVLHVTAWMRDMWSTLVLSTPRWPIANLIDTSGRALVYGDDVLGDLRTLFTSTQRTFADELGIIPLDLTQSLSRMDLDFSENVATKLLYEDFKPKAGVFSYWSEEYQRVLRTDQVVAKREILNDVLDTLPEGKVRSALYWLGDGFNVKLPTILKAYPGAIADFNTSIEFTYRLKMFHKEYFKLLETLEPEFMVKGLDALSPATKEVAQQVWKLSEGNPARLSGYVDNIVGASKATTPAEWALTVPANIDDLTKGMDAAQKGVFVSNVRASLDEMIQSAAKSGKRLTGDDFGKFFDQYKDQMKNEIQHVMEQSWDVRGMDSTIQKDLQANPVPTVSDLKGSAPVPPEVSPHKLSVEQATASLKRNRMVQKTSDIADSFETAISDYAKVERTPGDSVTYMVKNGQPTIVIGDDALKLKSGKFYDQLHDAVFNIFKDIDRDSVLRSGFNSVDEYAETVQKFMQDPTRVLADNEKQFATIVDEFTNHPQLMDILKRTGKDFNFDAAVDVYRNFGVYDDVYGFTKPPDQLVQDVVGKSIPTPGYYSAAARESALSTTGLGKLMTPEMAPELKTKVTNFIEQWDAYRKELHQYWFWRDVNPLSGPARRQAWDTLYYARGAESFKAEAKLKNELIAMFNQDPAKAADYLDNALQDFPSYFLKENGYNIVWDPNKQKILEIGLSNGKKIVNEADRALIARTFYTQDIERQIKAAPVLTIDPSGQVAVKTQMARSIRDTFKMPDSYANAWANVIDNHAQQWAKETGQTVEAYYERIGFQKLENGLGLGTAENFRLVKGGAVQHTPTGQFLFYGLGNSDFESLVRETGSLFFNDLSEMAKYSDKAASDFKAISDFIETKTGAGIRAGKLNQQQSDVFSELFTRYVAEGIGPDIKLKPSFERFKSYLSDTFKAVHTTPVSESLTDDVYRNLNGLFKESQMHASQTANTRMANVMAKQAGLDMQDAALLKYINENMPTGTFDQSAWNEWLARNSFTDVPTDALEHPAQFTQYMQGQMDKELQDIESTFKAAIETADPDTQVILKGNQEAERLAVEKRYNKLIHDAQQASAFKPLQPFTDLAEVPPDLARQVILTKNPQAEAGLLIDKEVQEAWDTWKTQRSLQGFPESATATPESFKAYLTDRMSKEWSEASWEYNRLMAETEQFQHAVMNHHVGDDFATLFEPRVMEANLSDGMKTWLRNSETRLNNYEAALNALDGWKSHMQGLDNLNPINAMTDAQKAELLKWADGAAKDKAEMIDVILHGGTANQRTYEGAINKVNRVMLDYQHRNVFDQMMKNIFPFWMFPSRSVPFWVETMATHPQIIAAYEKIQRMSRTQRYQAGAVTSAGKPLPSLDGYIQIPGTDLWFNPLAAFSFRYVLDVSKSVDNIVYDAQGVSEDDDPKTFLAKEFMDTSQIYGFSVAPWTSFLLKKAFNIPDDVLPSYALIPQISLIPRWFVQDQIQKASKLTNTDLERMGDAIYPEASWHDYLVERKILEDALMKVRSGNLTQAQLDTLRYNVQESIKNKNTDLWSQTYKDITNDEAYRSWGSFFTGVYAKPFTDGQAELLKLRNDINLLKSSMNSELQTEVFNLPSSAGDAYQNYINKLDSSDGWVARLYTDIGWVKNDLGQPVSDPKERAKWLAIQIENDENQSLYYTRMKQVQQEYNERLRALPLGSTYAQLQPIYEWYQTQRLANEYLRSPKSTYLTNKPSELIQQDLRDQWMRGIVSSKPSWNLANGETYDEYQARVKQWEDNLPQIAQSFSNNFERRNDVLATLHALRPDQQFDTKAFLDNLIQQSNTQGIDAWQTENDDIFDALNNAWKDTYWNAYWNSGVMNKGYKGDIASLDFYKQHPNPPTADELYHWIQNKYGDRFTLDEVKKYVEGSGELDIQQRQLEGQANPQDYTYRQKIWDMLSWLGPGSRNQSLFEAAFKSNGGNMDDLTVWYGESGQAFKTKPEKLSALYDSLAQTMAQLNVQSPSREDMVQYIQAQSENEGFRSSVTAELGEGFYDLLDYYNSMSDYDKKTFRKEQRDLYGTIKDYYAYKDQYGTDHPVWKQYYGFDLQPSIGANAGISNPDFQGGQFIAPKVYHSARGANQGLRTTTSSMRTAYSGGSKTPYFRLPSRINTTPSFSPAFTKAAGSSMMSEIYQLYYNNRPLSSAAMTFLRGLLSRHPEWSNEINNVLELGSSS